MAGTGGTILPDGGDAGSGGTAGAGPRDYGQDGPDTSSSFTATVTVGTSTFTELVYVPSSAGLHPVVSLSPGLQQPAAAYAPYAVRLASWGMIVLLRDDPGSFVLTPVVTEDLSQVVTTWLPAQHADSSSPLYGKVDVARVGLAGHSRGGKASLRAAEEQLHGKVKAWFGLDPVDSVVLGDNVLARTGLAAVGVPLGFLGASVATSCSPVLDNYTVLYAAAASPAVQVTAMGASHTDFEDPATCVACYLCAPPGTADPSVVLTFSVRYLTAFFARELLGDSNVGAAFEGAGGPADVAAARVQIDSK
jgi:predicted dienelactone hydrolase